MFKFAKKEKIIFTLIIVSFALKIGLMPIATHSDLFAVEIFPPLLFKNHIFDIFSYLDNLGLSYFYPPLSYYLFAFFQFVLQHLSSTYIPWLDHMRLSYIQGLQGQADAYIKAVPNPNLLKDLFIAKIPLLIFDVASIFILFKFVKRGYLKKEALLFWVLNPVVIYTTYLFGQFDVIVLFFILLGLFLIRKNKALGILTLGIAGALKSYPFIFVLPTALILGENLKEKLKLIILAFTPFLISISPTLINNPHLAVFALFPKNMFRYSEVLEGWPKYSQLLKYGLLILSYSLLLGYSYVLKLKDKFNTIVSVNLIVVLLALTFAGRTHFHYLIWEMPFMILYFKKDLKFLTKILLIQTISFASYKLLANPLQLGLFAPLNPQYFTSLPTFNDLIDKFISYRIISTTGFTIFTLLNIYLITLVFFQLVFKSEAVGSSRYRQIRLNK